MTVMAGANLFAPTEGQTRLTFKVLSALLCYPQADTLAALDDMAATVEQEKLLPAPQHAALLGFIDGWRRADLLELQEIYVALFDRGRHLSLHLFEHVHGESRDRGRAMVDLLHLYESSGFEIAAQELPDYLPLLLEYLAQRPLTEATSLLQDAAPVLHLLGARLAERGSPYQTVLDALGTLAGEPTDGEAVRRQAIEEGPDATLANMDQIWEEEAVSFLANPAACQTARQPNEHPIAFTPSRPAPSAVLTEQQP